jgi:hypothetical protein
MQAPLTKSAVARRQLATAIDLYFSGGDAVSVYSLAANAWEVIDVLCIRAGVESMSVQARENVPAGKDLKRNYINSPHRNFFKHAESDPDACLEPPSITHLEGLIFLAVEDYIRLHRRSPIQLQAFQAWYLAKYPDKIDPKVANGLTDNLQAAFPGLPSLSYPEQLAEGKRAINEASNDPEVLQDARTEPAFDW